MTWLVVLAAWLGALVGVACAVALPRQWPLLLKLVLAVLFTFVGLAGFLTFIGD